MGRLTFTGGLTITPGRVAALAVLVALSGPFAATLPGVALLFAPAALLLAVLLLGFSPGERLIARMRARRFPPRVARAPRSLALRHVVTVVRRVTSLAGSALAMRPPPAAPALTS